MKLSLRIQTLVAVLTLSPSLAFAAEGWTYEVLTTNLGPANDPMAINDLGEVVWVARESLAGNQERSVIYLTDGTTTTTLYASAPYPNGSFPLSASWIDVNDAHQVAFYGNLPGTGHLPPGLFRLRNGVPTPVPTGTYNSVQSNADLNSDGDLVFVGNLNPFGFGGVNVVTVNLADQIVAQTPVFNPISPGAANWTLPAINDNGDTAVAHLDSGISNVNRFRTWPRGAEAGTTTVVEVGPGSAVYSVDLNNIGFGSAVTQLPNSGGRRVLTVLPSGQGLTEVARVGGDIVELNTHTAISNTNAVTYAGQERNSQGQHRAFIAARDQGLLPVVVVRSGDPLFAGGPTIELRALSSGGFITKHSVNEKGQIAFRALLNGVPSMVRATPTPGLVSDVPILPPPGDVWTFSFPSIGGVATPGGGGVTYFDPPVATGYTYTSQHPSLRFGIVIVPAPLPGGDGDFEVEFGNTVQPLRAGVPFNFETFVPGGVSSFRITGISLAEGIDPSDVEGFVTGLGPVGTPEASATFTMVPIVENTDDFDGDNVIASRDNCPLVANADQADGDGDGVGNLCDNCPTTANVDQADGNNNGVGDACEVVVARACSVDLDGDIDRNDINLITAARNQPASGPTDPRDVDRSGRIDVNDARACTLRCDQPQCAIQ